MSNEDVASIEIFGSNLEASTTSSEEKRKSLNTFANPIGTKGQVMLNKRVVVKTLDGKFINGTYSGFSYTYNAFKVNIQFL